MMSIGSVYASAQPQESEVFQLIRSEDIAGLQNYLEANPLALREQKDGTGLSPICYAAQIGSELSVSVLLEYKADIEEICQGQTPLMWAAKMNHTQLVKYLLSRGAEVNRIEGTWSAIRLAAWAGNAEIVRILLEAKANPALPDKTPAPSIIQLASESGSAELLRLLLSYGLSSAKPDPYSANQPLHVAALHGNADAVQELLLAGISVDSRGELGRTALHLACSVGSEPVVDVVLREHAKSELTDDVGKTPIAIAAQESNDRILAKLLRLSTSAPGSDLADDLGWNPLHEAAACGSFRCAYLLVTIPSIDIDARTSFDRTALHLAALSRNEQIALLLIEHGIDPAIRDAAGHTALDYWKRPESRGLLSAMGEEPEEAVDSSDAERELPTWDGSDPVVYWFLNPGTGIKFRMGVRLAAWADGVVVFCSDLEHPSQTLRVGRVSPEDVRLLPGSLIDVGFMSIPQARYCGPDSESETISLRVGEDRYGHTWDKDLNPLFALQDASSIRRDFVRLWTLTARILEQLTPEKSFVLDGNLAVDEFRGLPSLPTSRPSWVR
jgi:ankyrin repeat protein